MENMTLCSVLEAIDPNCCTGCVYVICSAQENSDTASSIYLQPEYLAAGRSFADRAAQVRPDVRGEFQKHVIPILIMTLHKLRRIATTRLESATFFSRVVV